MKKILLMTFISVLLFSTSAYSQGDTLKLADKLEKGEAYSEKFMHPMTGETLERKIVGMEDGKCLYIEEMPNGGRMECRYSEEQRKAVAQYYRLNAEAELNSVSVKQKLDNKGKQEIKIIMDGKEVSNPLNVCLQDGTCVIKGY